MNVPIFDHHVHMDSRSANDYELMALTGVNRVLIPCTFSGERRHTAGDYQRYFERILNFERRRASAFGIDASVALAINVGDVADWNAVPEAVTLMDELLKKPGVAAIGELGFKDFTGQEIELFREQLRLARRHSLPAIVEAPWRQGTEALEHMASCISEAVSADGLDPKRLILVDVHVEQLPVVWELGLGGYGIPAAPRHDLTFAIHRKAGAEEIRAAIEQYGDERIMLNSALHFGVGDPMGIARVLLALRTAGLSTETLQRIAYDNAAALFTRVQEGGNVT